MKNLDLLLQGWNWNPVVLLFLAVATVVYALSVGLHGRPWCFAGALLLAALVLLSPLDLLASGVLFSAHMAQHIVLLLFVPALVLLSLPAKVASRAATSGRLEAGSLIRTRERRPFPARLSIVGWLLGVGSMWFWHVPQLCDAAAGSGGVHAIQTISLLVMGAAFWWPILAPQKSDRLMPGLGIVYLFTACLACTALGILLSLTTIQACPIFRQPSTAPAIWANLRSELTATRDQQIGGLLMWLPMCLVYLGAIVLELTRWFGEPAAPVVATSHETS